MNFTQYLSYKRMIFDKNYCKQSEVKFPAEQYKNEVGNKDCMQKVNFTKIIKYLNNNRLL